MTVSGTRNALTIDVEDYFQVSAFAPHIPRSEWPLRECRVERNVDIILSMLDQHDTKATFFTLGWIAERYPHIVRQIVANGHEIASHGYGHERATDQSPDSFFADVNVAKLILEDIAGTEIKGYRAPSFSIGEKNLWAFECLEKAGYLYSSSIYPIRHDHYGMPNAPRHAHSIGNLLEIPATTLRFFSRNWPASGGGYFRLLPYGLSRWMIQRINHVDQLPAVFYFHPWEIDVEQPRVEGVSAKTRFRHYLNIHRMEQRLHRLLGDFSWTRMDKLFLNKA
ncbi:XrtA system polysaccharide deacetylase [uncultured Dechloromonas sp.]|uniref:XrtA system polysaccharide deacetylase n=1 Tax=uncultured Dechloromonas sp. TaxID=171719 RepID=UPI0025F46EAF|nr:XrtA system polysaccharide deacetylase [uncultured Dechloromonas sp.]